MIRSAGWTGRRGQEATARRYGHRREGCMGDREGAVMEFLTEEDA